MQGKQYSGIWIYAQQENGVIEETVFELLGKAKELQAHNAEKITAVLLGSGVAHLVQTLFDNGAQEVILAEDAALAEYSARPYQQALTELAERHRPSMILYGATPIGVDLAPRMMVSLNTGLTADAIDLCYDEDGLFCQTTPGYGGKILAHIAIETARPQMATVHPRMFQRPQPVPGAAGKLIVESVTVSPDPDYEVLQVSERINTERRLNEASVVVSGGRGLKAQGDLGMLQELAELLGGELGCSRPLVDKLWLPHGRQIGQSGVTITPELLLNVAISGSVQYQLGMQKAKCVVAVNQDADAPIFDLANYGVVADYRIFIPALTAQLKARSENKEE